MGKVVGKLSTRHQTPLLSKRTELSGRRTGGNHGRVCSAQTCSSTTLHCGLLTLVTVGGSGCLGGLAAVAGTCPMASSSPWVALFLSGKTYPLFVTRLAIQDALYYSELGSTPEGLKLQAE